MNNIQALLHYSGNLLSMIYPLTEEEFNISSIERRAATDYCEQITEAIHSQLNIILKYLNVQKIKFTKKDRLNQAHNQGIIPLKVFDESKYLIDIRNETTHNNLAATEKKYIYNNLFRFIIVAYTFYEIFFYIDYLYKYGNHNPPKNCMLVNKAYIINKLTIIINDQNLLNKALKKIENETESDGFLVNYTSLSLLTETG
jgi:hypothetical protein